MSSVKADEVRGVEEDVDRGVVEGKPRRIALRYIYIPSDGAIFKSGIGIKSASSPVVNLQVSRKWNGNVTGPALS